MANANFDKWLRLNKKPNESLRDAIYRFSDNTKNPRAAKEYLVDEYREAVDNEDYNQSVQEMPEQQQEGQPYAGKSEEIDPETGKLDEYDWTDPPARAVQQLKKTVGGSLFTLGLDSGVDWSREADKRLKQIARPPTRAEIEKEGGFLGSVYGELPEGWLGPGQMVEQGPSSLLPYGTSIPAWMMGGPVAGFGAGYLTSNLQVAGETATRIIDDPIVKRELDIPNLPYEELSPTQQQNLKDFAREVSRSAGLRRMYTAGLIEAPSLFMPAFKVNKLIPEFIKRQALDITFGSISEVVDEELYASNVANALMDKGMDEASGAMLKKEIRDMGPEAWEVFWGAFSQELTMGSVGTGAEVTASRIMGKNRDYRVDDTKTDRNEVQNEIARQQEELLPQYKKEAQEAQDKQDKKDREDREEQVKLDNAQLDFAIKLDQLNLNREKAEQDRVKAEEERLDRMIEQEETFAKNLPKTLPLVEQQRIYARKRAALVKQGWDPKSIYMDNEGEARIKIGADLEGLTEDDVRPDKVTGKPVPVTPDLTKPRAGEKIKVFNKDGEQVEVKVTKSQGPNVTVVGPRKKGPDGKFVKPVPSLLDTDTGQFFSNNPTEQVADEVAPVKKPLSEFSITELLNEESKLEKQAPTPQLKDQNVELQNIKTEIAKRDERMLTEEPAERVDRLREDGTVSYSETATEQTFDSPLEEARALQTKNDEENPVTLSSPVMKKVLNGIMGVFDQLKLKGLDLDVDVKDRNDPYERYLEGNEKKFSELSNKNPDDFTQEDKDLIAAQTIVDSLGAEAYIDDRPREDEKTGEKLPTRVVLIGDNIRGKSVEEVTRKVVQKFWHEVFGHKAVREAFGGIDDPRFVSIMEEFDKNNGPDIDQWLKERGKAGGYAYINKPRFVQVQEFVARQFAEFGIKNQGKFRKFISQIRAKLREMGFSTIREQDLIAIFEQLQDEYIPNNRSIITGKPLTPTRVQAQEEEDTQTATTGEEQVSESRGRRPSDFDRFVSFGGKPPLKQYDRPKFDTARAPKKTAKDAEHYVDASLLASMKGKAWPERLVEDLMNFDKFPKEFQKGFRKSLKSGLREPEQKLANAILASGREAYLKKKKGAAWRDRDKWALTQPPKGYEANGAKWKELVDDVPKWARTTPEIQRGMREQDISESVNSPEFKKWFGDSKVIDKKGKPLMVYHSTGGDIKSFDKSGPRIKSGKLGKGIYVTPSKGLANLFAKVRAKDGAPNVMPLYVSIKNPFIINGEKNIPTTTISRSSLEDRGYDGIILNNENGSIKEAVAFNPSQIKSQFNKGTWSTDTPDISESRAESPITRPPAGKVWHGTTLDKIGRIISKGLAPGSAIDRSGEWVSDGSGVIVEFKEPSTKTLGKRNEYNKFDRTGKRITPEKIIFNLDQISSNPEKAEHDVVVDFAELINGEGLTPDKRKIKYEVIRGGKKKSKIKTNLTPVEESPGKWIVNSDYRPLTEGPKFNNQQDAENYAIVNSSIDLDDISESATYFPDQKLKPIFPMPPKAFPGGYAEQKWANRLDPEDTPVYRKGGKFIDVSRGFPVKDSDPDMTNTIVPFGEIDTDFPGSRASFGVSGAVSKIKNLADNKPKKGQRKVNGKRISTGSAIMTNLLTKKFKFLDANPNVKTNTENIAAMDNGAIVEYNKENDQSATKAGNFSDHLYAVQIIFDTDVQLFNTGKDKNQPSLRPKTYGDILVGDQVGTIKLDTGTVAPLYDRLIVIPPSKDEISYSFVGEVGVRQFITRNGMNPKGKMLTRDLNRQKKGSKEGAWFNPGLEDGKWRVEVPNTGIKLKTMPFKYDGWRDTYDTVIDPSLPTRKQVFTGEDKKGKIKKQKTEESLPYMRLGDLLDLGALADYYPQLEDVYVHFADEFMGERMGYSSALQNPSDDNPTGKGLSLTIGTAPPDPETMRNLDMDQMTMTTQGWIEDIHMKMMNDPNHDGVPHRLIASILHEVQHIIQAIEGFSSGGTLTEENITKDRIKNAIRNSTRGLWVSISPEKRLRIQKRFASTLNDLVNNDQKKAKDAVSRFGLKSPFVGKKWSDGSLFLDEDPTKTYQRWSKTTTISVTDLINDPNEASNRKFENLVSLPSKAMMQTIGSLSREKIISMGDAGKVHKLFENMLKPYTMNALGSMMGNQIPSGFAPDQMKRLMGQSDYFRLAGEVEARDVENRYLDAFRGNGRSGLPSLLNKRKQELVKRLSPSKPYLQGGTERGVVNIDESGTGTTPVNVPGEAILGAPWRIEDMISYSMSDPLGDFAERVDVVTRARVAQINNLEKGTPERRNAIEKLHMNIILSPIPVQDPTKPLPFQDELDRAVPFEDLSWSQRLPGHELSGVELMKKYMKNPEEWEKIRTEKGGYETSGDTVEDIDTDETEGDDAGAGGRGKSAKITGLGLKGKVSLRQKKGETKEAYKERISRQAQKDYGALTKRAARLLYLGKIWTNWQMIRDMFGLNPGGRGRDAVPYLGHIISFMKMQREKLMRGEMTPRDIAKSVVMTLASQGADANNPWTVWNFTGGVKKAKPAKKGTKLANLTTYVEYMNGADWVKGTSKYLEANIGQKELNGEINEGKVVDWYNKAPLWIVNVPWNGQGPSKGLRKKRGVNEYVEKFDTQYEAISDGVIFPKTVSWEEASTTPAYDSKGNPIEGRFQYSGGKPQFVKVGSDWMLQVDGKNYHGMGHYNSQLSHNRYENNILKVKIPELKTQIKKYQNDIKLNEKKLKDEFAGKKPEYTQKGELKAEYTAPRIEVAKKKIKEKTIPKIEGYIKKRETEIASLRKKIKESQAEADKSGKKKQLAEMPLWYRDPQNQIEPNENTGALWVPQEYATTGGKPRMEDAVAYYFSTDEGQMLLDNIEKGEFDLKEWRKLANVRMAFGDDRLNQLLKPSQRDKDGNLVKVGLRDLAEYTKGFNEIVKKYVGDADPKSLQGDDKETVKLRLEMAAELGDYAQKLYGIAEAKQAFFKHFLGLGDAPTIDAIELNTHIAGSPATDLATSPLTGKPVANTWRVDLKWWSLTLQGKDISGIDGLGKKGKADNKTFFGHYRKVIQDAFDNIKRDVDARDPSIFEDVPPDYFYHVMHHWLWDVGKALTRADAVMGESTERYRPAAYEAMWRDNNQQVLAYFKNDPIEATMVPWVDKNYARLKDIFEAEHGTPVAMGRFNKQDVSFFEQNLDPVSESVNLSSIYDKEFFAAVADRYATGFYEAEDQTSTIWPDIHPVTKKKGYWMRGGMGFTTMHPYAGKGIVWAADGESIISGVINLIKRGITHVVETVGAQDQLLSNRAYFRIWSMETDDGIRRGLYKRDKINDMIAEMRGQKISIVPDPNLYGETIGEIEVPLGSDLVTETRDRKGAKLFRTDKLPSKKTGEVPGLSGTDKRYSDLQVRMNDFQLKYPREDNWDLFKRAMVDTPFDDRKKLIVMLGGNWFGSVKNPSHVAAPHRPIWEKTAVYKDVVKGTPVGLIRLDVNQEEKLLAEKAGVPEHEAYKYLLKGKVLATYDQNVRNDILGAPDPIERSEMFANWEKAIGKEGYFEGKAPKKDKDTGKVIPGKFLTPDNAFRSLSINKTPFSIPGAVFDQMEAEWSSGHTPVSFSNVVRKLSTDPVIQNDLDNALQKQAEWATSESIFSSPLDRDKELPGGRKLSGFVTRFMEPFGKLDEPQTLRDIRRRARGRILRVEEIGGKLYKALKNTKSPELIYKYLTTKGGDLSIIPNLRERAAAKEVKRLIERVGKDLLDRGLLNQAALDKHGDGYLPVIYLQYLLDDNDRYNVQRGFTNKVSSLDYLKGRRDPERIIKMMVKGEVKDPAFLGSRAVMQPGRDMALLDMFEEIVNTSVQNDFNWVLPDALVEFNYLKEINDIAGRDSAVGRDLKDELAGIDAEEADIKEYIEELNGEIKKEREVLRAKDRMQSEALSALIKERLAFKERLKAFKPRHMSGWGLKAEAERIRNTIAPTFPKGSTEESIVLRLAKRMEDLGNQTNRRVIVPKDYKEIPNNARYGKLRGMIVQREIYDDLVGATKMTDPESIAEMLFGDTGAMGKANRWFKFAKVTANFPGAWVRNFTSNIIFMNIGGMNLAKSPYLLTKAFKSMLDTWIEDRKANEAMLSGKQYTKKKTVYDEVKDMGLTGSTFAAVELGRIEKEFENFLNRTQRSKTPFGALYQVWEFLALAKEWVSDQYGLTDSLGKTMMYMNSRDKGMTKKQSADEAEKWLFDYSLVKPSVKWARQSIIGAPFITYTTKVLPLLVETAMTKPWRFAPYIALPYAMAAFFKAEYELEEDEYEALMNTLPEYLREKRYAGNIMPIPYLDEHGRAQFLDLAYLYPWGMYTEIASEAMDDPSAIQQTLGLMGGPVASIIAVITTGVDPFTRRPVSNPLDSQAQQWKDKMKYVYNLMMPPFLHTDYGAYSRIQQTLDGELNRYGEPMKTIGQGVSQAVGFNISPVDPDFQGKLNARYLQSEILKTQGLARRTLKSMAMQGKSNKEIAEKNKYFRELIMDRKKKFTEYLKLIDKFPAHKLKEKKVKYEWLSE